MDRFLSFIPFLLIQNRRCGDSDEGGVPNSLRLNIPRIIEAIVIAAIAGLFSGYIAVAKLEIKVEANAKNMAAMEQRICDENKRQEARIDSNLDKLERLTTIVLDRVKK